VLLLAVLGGVGYVVYPRPSHAPSAASHAPTAPTAPAAQNVPPPLAARSYAGALILNQSGSQLASWNQTSSYCPTDSGWSADGTVGTNSAGDVTLKTSGKSGSCAALISPNTYSAGIIEADINFPALPGTPGTIANWTAFWLTYGPTWPTRGELDAVEVEPVTGRNAVSWHSGTVASEFSASTDDLYATKLPAMSANLTPGWHVVDIVYTKGFFAISYDGREFTEFSSSNVTGAPLNIQITTSVTPNIASVVQKIGGTPKNSDTSPATVAVKYVRVWALK
jgi:hypothetical protein